MNDDQIKSTFQSYYNDAIKKYEKEKESMSPEAQKQTEKILNYYQQVIKNPKTVKTNGIGFGCINNATSGFGKGNQYASNVNLLQQTLKGNTNYEALDWDNTKLQIGDIIQIGDGKAKNPHHAVQVTGFNFLGIPQITQVHADDASMDDKSINSSIDYIKTLLAGKFGSAEGSGISLSKPQGLKVIRYKGSNAERKQWAKEYKQSHKNGGNIIHLIYFSN